MLDWKPAFPQILNAGFIIWGRGGAVSIRGKELHFCMQEFQAVLAPCFHKSARYREQKVHRHVLPMVLPMLDDTCSTYRPSPKALCPVAGVHLTAKDEELFSQTSARQEFPVGSLGHAAHRFTVSWGPGREDFCWADLTWTLDMTFGMLCFNWPVFTSG